VGREVVVILLVNLPNAINRRKAIVILDKTQYIIMDIQSAQNSPSKPQASGIAKYRWPVVGVLLGGLGGYFYWKEIGCLTGTCPLQSQWQTMIPYGMLIGYWATDFIKPIFKKTNQ
jgi:hypothetical protein